MTGSVLQPKPRVFVKNMLVLPRGVAHLQQHLDACYSLEGQQQEGHEGQPLALRRLLETSDDRGELRVVLPVDQHEHTCQKVRNVFTSV